MAADPSDDFGSRLRAARERKGIALREIANRTKISVAVLEALERNDISRLPGGIFSRAFVRSYAHEVGLDPEQTIQEFLAQFPHDSVIAGHPRSDRVEDTELFESDRRVASSALWILGASVVLAGAVLYLSVAREDHPVESATAPAAVSSAPAAPPTQPAASDIATETAATSGATTPAVAPVRAPEPPAAAATGQPATSVPTAASGPAEPVSGDRLTVVLAARRPVWVSATVDGQKALGRLLQTGEEQRVEVTREMVMTAGDAAAVRMTLNGSEARPIGKTGEVVTVRVTLANFKGYLAPR
jgi:cytoskeleton protein RodZ